MDMAIYLNKLWTPGIPELSQITKFHEKLSNPKQPNFSSKVSKTCWDKWQQPILA